MKVRVRPYFVLFLDGKTYQEGSILEVSEDQIKDQMWKVEILPEDRAIVPPSDISIKKGRTR